MASDQLDKVRSFIQFANESLTRSEFKDAFQKATSLIRAAITDLNVKIDRRLAELKDGPQGPEGKRGPKGEKGDKGDKGDQGVQGIQGPAGKDADPKDVVRLTLPQVLAEIDKRVPLLGDALRSSLEDHVNQAVAKRPYSMGGGAVVSIQHSGVNKVNQASTLNFTGAGAPTVSLGSNGVTNLSFASGGGFTELAATETPDGSTTVFTFSPATAQPSYIVADNVWLKATSKAGTVNWTWNNSTKQATLTIPPNDDIYAIV